MTGSRYDNRLRRSQEMTDSTWTAIEAKARFSELIERARTRPQTITRRANPWPSSCRQRNGKGSRIGPAIWPSFSRTHRFGERKSISDGTKFGHRRPICSFQLDTNIEWQAVANSGPRILTAESSLKEAKNRP